MPNPPTKALIPPPTQSVLKPKHLFQVHFQYHYSQPFPLIDPFDTQRAYGELGGTLNVGSLSLQGSTLRNPILAQSTRWNPLRIHASLNILKSRIMDISVLAGLQYPFIHSSFNLEGIRFYGLKAGWLLTNWLEISARGLYSLYRDDHENEIQLQNYYSGGLLFHGGTLKYGIDLVYSDDEIALSLHMTFF